MPMYICETCGTQYAQTSTPPPQCPVCDDERQYVGWNGQTWTTHALLAAKHKLRLEDDQGLLGIGLSPDFAINQRALYLPTDAGNILWECVSLVTDEAVTELKARGGVDKIIISHPHFYSSMVEWSEALGRVPILVHEADRAWRWPFPRQCGHTLAGRAARRRRPVPRRRVAGRGRSAPRHIHVQLSQLCADEARRGETHSVPP